MAWTTPKTWTSGELVTAALKNAHVRDNMLGITDGYWLDPQAFVVGSGAALSLVGSAGGLLRALIWAFDPTTTEYIIGMRLLPSYLRGGTTQATIYWAPSTANTGTVIWNLHTATIAAAEQIDQAADETDAFAAQAGSGSAEALHITSTVNLTALTGPLVRIVVQRDIADTNTGDAWFLGLLLQRTA